MRENAAKERNTHSVKLMTRWAVAFAAFCGVWGMAGCRQAPTFNIMGSFFPAWLICLVAGMALAFAANRILVRLHLDQQIVWQILVYPCLALFFACILWLIFFR
ncbi:MAG TPA: YtcA family lipoprotein [Terracidiphilus sp.]|jgi:hypothetical protein|nr:YtcA family lipoprotein [Terracidiphilus sp.]